MLRNSVQTALAVVFPSSCIGCRDRVESDYSLCGACWRDLPLIGGLVCDCCGTPLLDGHDDAVVLCDRCLKHPRPWDQGRCALLYQDLGRSLILALKHGDKQEVARLAAPWLARSLSLMSGPDPVLVPVPLHWTRLARRRFNQSASLVQALGKQTGYDMCLDGLGRYTKTQSLDGMTQKERFQTLSGAIHVSDRNKARLEGRRVVIVDDVMTTGATLEACANAVVSAGAQKVDVLALARVAKDT